MVNVGFNSGFQQQLFVLFPASSSPSIPTHKVSADLIEQLNDIIMAQYDMSLYERRIFIKVIELMPLELPEFNLELPEFDLELSEFDFELPKFNLELPDNNFELSEF